MDSPREDIDPAAEDVVAKRRRVRPEADAGLVAERARALAKAKARPASPGVMLEPCGEGYELTAPHSDRDLWELQIADAFGTRSQSVIRSFTAQLQALGAQVWDAPNGTWKPDETELNAALAMVHEWQPRTMAEAALAAQMVVTHLLTMRLGAQALNRGGMVIDRDAALTGKLARTYAQQIETFQALRGKRKVARQSIKVSKEQHIHVHYTRGVGESGSQPHDTRTSIPAQCAALPGPEQGGQIVRLPSRKRKAGV